MHIKSYCAAHRHGLFSPQSNTGRAVLSLAFALVLTVVGLISIFDTDKTVSEEENRKLATKPKFSFTALFDKSYTSDFDTYYADTFPFRAQQENIGNTHGDQRLGRHCSCQQAG